MHLAIVEEMLYAIFSLKMRIHLGEVILTEVL
jgi:hypothetical protein